MGSQHDPIAAILRFVDERLARVVDALRTTPWAAFALDNDNRLEWVSDELRTLLSADSDDELGIGRHVMAALTQPLWVESMTPETGLAMFRAASGYLLADGVPDDVIASLPAGFADLVAEVRPVDPPPVWCDSFEFLPRGRPSYRVDYAVVRVRDIDGDMIGTVSLSNMGVRAGLLAELGRGDAAMYERMARLVQPDRHAAAILFADLQASGALSRMLPTAAYFGLVRDLTSTFDALVAEHAGIVGKHAGDGWTAFVLADDAGTPSTAVAGCFAVARDLHRKAEALTETLTSPAGTHVRINVGVHWAAGVYLGQLVPGSRLDVTALGDEVNECARIQECARSGAILVSKQAMELLDADDAKQLGVDPATALYQALAELDAATEKTRRDAGTLAVTSLTFAGHN